MKQNVAFSFILAVGCFVTCSHNHSDTLWGSGTLEATEVTISAQIMGQILSLEVEEGSIVKQGDVIAVIDTEKLQWQRQQLEAGLEELNLNIANAVRAVTQAETQFQNIEKRYQRVRALFEQESASQQQLDDLETQYKVAQTQLSAARTSHQALLAKQKQLEAQKALLDRQIADGTVKAPISGVVIDKFVQPGEVITTGMPVVSLADLSKMWIKIYISETEVGKVKLNGDAEVLVDSFPNRTFPGKVIWISPKAEFTPKNVQTKEARVNLVYAVKVSIPNPKGELKIGMPADVILKK